MSLVNPIGQHVALTDSLSDPKDTRLACTSGLRGSGVNFANLTASQESPTFWVLGSPVALTGNTVLKVDVGV